MNNCFFENEDIEEVIGSLKNINDHLENYKKQLGNLRLYSSQGRKWSNVKFEDASKWAIIVAQEIELMARK